MKNVGHFVAFLAFSPKILIFSLKSSFTSNDSSLLFKLKLRISMYVRRNSESGGGSNANTQFSALDFSQGQRGEFNIRGTGHFHILSKGWVDVRKKP